jgi:hypothetical protein
MMTKQDSKRKTERNSHSSCFQAAEFRKPHNVKIYKRNIASSATGDMREKVAKRRLCINLMQANTGKSPENPSQDLIGDQTLRGVCVLIRP